MNLCNEFISKEMQRDENFSPVSAVFKLLIDRVQLC